MSHDESPGPGQTLFAFVRHWSRRRADPTSEELARRGRTVAVVEAVQSLARRESPSVSDVAAELGVDQSGASRMIKEAVDAGHLALGRSEADGRRRVITVTEAGVALLIDAHRWQELIFESLTDGWTIRQRADFHRAMVRMLDRSRFLNS